MLVEDYYIPIGIGIPVIKEKVPFSLTYSVAISISLWYIA